MSFFKSNIPAALVVGMACVFPAVSYGVPTLQLGITGGTYDTTTETIMASSNLFSLNAYLTLTSGGCGSSTTDGYYYLSYALTPRVETPVNAGSFTINGQTFNATEDLTYGVPPLDQYNQLFDSGDLSPHDVFPTYFGEMEFTFGGNQTGIFDTQTNPGQNPLVNSGSGMHFEQFLIDVSNLDSKFAIHFDLYSTTTTTTKRACVEKDSKGRCKRYSSLIDTDVARFAPFSHDAQSGNGGGGNSANNSTTRVPEPASLALLGLGLIGLGAASRRRRTC